MFSWMQYEPSALNSCRGAKEREYLLRLCDAVHSKRLDMCHEGWLLSTALQHLHSASWTQPVERLDQPIGLEFLDRTVVCLGRLRKAWRSPIPKERRSGNVCSRMVVNAIAYFFLPRWNFRTSARIGHAHQCASG
jgi:hypothetical protein